VASVVGPTGFLSALQNDPDERDQRDATDCPQAHFSSSPDFGLISDTRLVTTSKTKMNTGHRGGATFGLVTGETLHAGGHDPVPTETRATIR